jgi:hypothetical protein
VNIAIGSERFQHRATTCGRLSSKVGNDRMDQLAMKHQQLLDLIEKDTRPSSLIDCLDLSSGAGSPIDLARFLELSAKQDEIDALDDSIMECVGVKNNTEEVPAKKRKERTCKSLRPYYFNDKGEQVFLRPRQTIWYYLYVLNPLTECLRWKKKFRRRLRMNYDQYKVILGHVVSHDSFTRWTGRWRGNGKDVLRYFHVRNKKWGDPSRCPIHTVI